MENELLELCLNKLNDYSKDLDINKENIIILVKYTMEVIELTEFKGAQQKVMAIQLIKKFVECLDDDVKKAIHPFIDESILSSTIDLIVDATKGKLNINIKKKLKRFCCI